MGTAAHIFSQLGIPDPLTSKDPHVQLVTKVTASIIVLVVTLFVSVKARGRLQRGLEVAGFQINVAVLLARALAGAVWIIGALSVLYVFGVGLAPLAAVIGVVGLAASLSLQQVLQNLVAGVYLLAERPFQIGDEVALVGPAGLNHQGRVQDIQMRTTHLRNRDDELILVPNSAIFGGVITNRTAVGGFVSKVTVSFPRGTEPEAVREKIVPLLQGLPAVLSSPSPSLYVDKANKDEWTGCVSFWSSTPQATSEVVWAMAGAFPEATFDSGTAVT